MVRFLAFNKKKYRRNRLEHLIDSELAALEEKDPSIQSFSPEDVAEVLNNRGCFDNMWIFPVDDNFI